MNKYKKVVITIVSLIILLTFAAACSNQVTGADISDITWQWVSLVENEPASQSVVLNPENYTIYLNSDGTLNIQADCNMVSGSYAVEENTLTLELGPSTMAFCGEESLDLMFTELLNSVESYTIENNQLVLNLDNNTGKMTFNK
ncbi:MAG: META domain-containing protein [Anaerolineales bacterium]|nr:META domain-containing protein [Anaerolineales bacterium]